MSEDNPFEDLEADDVDPSLEDPFEEMDTENVDEEALWEELTDDPEEDADAIFDELAEEGPAEYVAAEVDSETNEAVVPKSSYCQRCEHFDAPPSMACTNPGTDIVELVDIDRFRVRNCPVVADRQGDRDAALQRNDES